MRREVMVLGCVAMLLFAGGVQARSDDGTIVTGGANAGGQYKGSARDRNSGSHFWDGFVSAQNAPFWTVMVVGDTLRITKPADDLSVNPYGVVVAGMESSFSLVGDFTVIVDFDLRHFPIDNGSPATLSESNLTVHSDNDGFSVLRYAHSTGQYIEAYGPAGPIGVRSETTTAGRYRIVRQGDIITGSYAPSDGADFVELGSYESMSCGVPMQLSFLAIQSRDTLGQLRASDSLDIAFDNLVIQAGGACCHADGSCSFVLQAGCSTPDIWQGVGIPCDPDPCPQPGACCANSGACSVKLQAVCSLPSVWEGSGSACTPNPCPQPSGAGSIVAWGANYSGQCNIPSPNVDFVAVAGGATHSLGLKSDGTIVAWGSNANGLCDVPSPNTEFVAVAAGYWLSLGLKSDSTIVAWGVNSCSELTIPEPNADFVAVAGGDCHSLGLKSDGTIVAWGLNNEGQCDVPTPNADFTAIAAGLQHSLGLKSDGTIVAWGLNNEGQCDVPTPNAGFVAVAGGGEHSLGLKSDGTIIAWGWNRNGQCNVPTPNAEFVAVAGGGEHSLGLKSDGTIIAWGDNRNSQCNVPIPNADFTAVAAGEQSSLGLRTEDGACCHNDGVCFFTTQQDCLMPAVWEGEHSFCTPNPCPPGGACCETTGLCTVMPAQTCPETSTWQGAGIPCAPNPCLLGACCVYLACESYTPENCTTHGGTFQGNGTLCSPNPCPTSGVDGGSASWTLKGPSAVPNPSAGGVTIRYQLPKATTVTLEIFSASGALVRKLAIGQQPAGPHEIQWDGRDDAGAELPSGVFFARIQTTSGMAAAKITVTK